MAQVIRIEVYTLDDSIDADAVADLINISDTAIVTDWTNLNMRDVVDSLDKDDLLDLGFVICCDCGNPAHCNSDDSVLHAYECTGCGSDICGDCYYYCEGCEDVLCAECIHMRDNEVLCEYCFDEGRKKCKKSNYQ